jgi:hypothetical protein cdiviTM7_01222
MRKLDQESQTTPENIFNNSENASNEKRSISVGAAMGIAIGGVVLCGLGFVAGMQVGGSSGSQMSRQAGGPPGMSQSQGGRGGSRQQSGGNGSTSQAQSGEPGQSGSSSTGQTPSVQNNTTNTPPSDASQSGTAPQPTSQSSRQ